MLLKIIFLMFSLIFSEGIGCHWCLKACHNSKVWPMLMIYNLHHDFETWVRAAQGKTFLLFKVLNLYARNQVYLLQQLSHTPIYVTADKNKCRLCCGASKADVFHHIWRFKITSCVNIMRFTKWRKKRIWVFLQL